MPVKMTDTIETITSSQQTASHPNHSVWVAASAGSGKTKVLTDRVLNLLLTNTPGEKILCLTFTNAAAAEMYNRINNTLKSWAILSDDDLTVALKKVNNFDITPELIKKARDLFITVLETPGGMKITTIHSFCQSILRRFPFEAQIPPQSDVIDDLKSLELLKTAGSEVFSNPLYTSDINTVCHYLDDNNIDNMYKIITGKRVALNQCFLQYKDIKSIENKLRQHFNLMGYHTEQDIINHHFKDNDFPYLQSLYFKKGKKELLLKYALDDTANQVLETTQKLDNFFTMRLTLSLMRLIKAVMDKYSYAKTKNGYLDYTDLILITKQLLVQSNMASWVLFKLDGGINHILVDEAQDTSPEQWDIIQAICTEFFAGLGQDTSLNRTLFVVGDKKQSIFSMQGADPDAFEQMHDFFEHRIQAAQKSFKTVPLNMSFRSTEPVLRLVNALLEDPLGKQGILHFKETAPHTPFRNQEAGLVEIWPLEGKDEVEKLDTWKMPTSGKNTLPPCEKLAEKIALKIKNMLDSNEILVSQGRPIMPSDIMILVAKRSMIVPALVKALVAYNIPVAGVDRLVLTDHIAVEDLLSLAQFVLLPEDDLNLACLLKSPLFNLSEDDIFNLAHNRGDYSLWRQVGIILPEVKEKLLDLLNKADTMPIFEFFAYVLGPLQGRKAFVSRLGEEVNDALDAFLDLTLDFEQKHIPVLQEFLKWIKNQSITIKRDLEQEANAVRIMTIHASKGLQGNIVFLPDMMRKAQSPDIQFHFTDDNLPIWIAKSNLKTAITTPLIQKAKEKQKEESRRLLYVALTRAKDRLYIAGFSAHKPKDASKIDYNTTPWYDLIVKSALTLAMPDENGVITLQSPQLKEVQQKISAVKTEIIAPLPDYIDKMVQIDDTIAPLAPSKSGQVEGSQQAMAQGIFIHQLLEKLPQIPRENWHTYINTEKPDNCVVPHNFLTIFDKPDFSFLFDTSALSEVPITGMIEGVLFSGKMDKLVVKDNQVWVIDYKSNQHPPKSADKIPLSYKMQLDAYKHLLFSIFPDKKIKTFLLWTHTMELMEYR